MALLAKRQADVVIQFASAFLTQLPMSPSSRFAGGEVMVQLASSFLTQLPSSRPPRGEPMALLAKLNSPDHPLAQHPQVRGGLWGLVAVRLGVGMEAAVGEYLAPLAAWSAGAGSKGH